MGGITTQPSECQVWIRRNELVLLRTATSAETPLVDSIGLHRFDCPVYADGRPFDMWGVANRLRRLVDELRLENEPVRLRCAVEVPGQRLAPVCQPLDLGAVATWERVMKFAQLRLVDAAIVDDREASPPVVHPRVAKSGLADRVRWITPDLASPGSAVATPEIGIHPLGLVVEFEGRSQPQPVAEDERWIDFIRAHAPTVVLVLLLACVLMVLVVALW